MQKATIEFKKFSIALKDEDLETVITEDNPKKQLDSFGFQNTHILIFMRQRKR